MSVTSGRVVGCAADPYDVTKRELPVPARTAIPLVRMRNVAITIGLLMFAVYFGGCLVFLAQNTEGDAFMTAWLFGGSWVLFLCFCLLMSIMLSGLAALVTLCVLYPFLRYVAGVVSD